MCCKQNFHTHAWLTQTGNNQMAPHRNNSEARAGNYSISKHFHHRPTLNNKPPYHQLRLTLLGLLFTLAVLVTAYYHHTLLLPVFVGMAAMLKSWLKLLTPKFLFLLLKNSVFIKLKQVLISGSTRLLVFSHKPWRHRLRSIRKRISQSILATINFYTGSPLWLRTAIALGLLIITASSSYIIIALLIIPQPILNWFKKLLLTTLNKLGITQLLKTVWKYLIPAKLRDKWYLHSKWAVGRRRVNTAKRLRARMAIRSNKTTD